ncbi:MAG: macro domain-containing protein [Planctomycetes bacterium]|nr:macro domain-containing protein [Planctomycetota bacterium]
MIRYTQGNLLAAPADALVNTVNEVGVMGKGIALLVREAFPENARAYEAACKREEVRVGHMFVTRLSALAGPRWIINFPTKKHWRNPSRMEWIRDGLQDLARVVRLERIRSVALPPLGCGNGGLEWMQVRREIEAALADLDDVEVVVYEPTSAYYNAPKREGIEELTPARALIAALVQCYLALGLDCTVLEVQKLAWFLDRALRASRLKDPLDLRFKANKYGPYADRLRHLLNGLDGSFLHCDRRLADAGPFDLIWFERSKQDAVEAFFRSDEGKPFFPALEKTVGIIDGFESPLGLELLATVDWLLEMRNCDPTVPAIRTALAKWPGGRAATERKQRLFDDRLIQLALDRVGPIERRLAAIWAEVPAEELAKIPPDLSENLDKHIYGPPGK